MTIEKFKEIFKSDLKDFSAFYSTKENDWQCRAEFSMDSEYGYSKYGKGSSLELAVENLYKGIMTDIKDSIASCRDKLDRQMTVLQHLADQDIK